MMLINSTTLRDAVEKQSPAERRETVIVHGQPHYRKPGKIDLRRGPCCKVSQPCPAHKMAGGTGMVL